MRRQTVESGCRRRGLHVIAWAVVLAAAACEADGLPIADLAAADLGTAPRALRVLFVGNSYTFFNDLPGQVWALGGSLPSPPPPIAVEVVAVGGATLGDHYASTGALGRIREGGWTHVVLQGQSVEPLAWPDDFEQYAAKLGAEAAGVGATVVYFETWARAAGDAVYREPWSGGTPAAMQAGLRREYAMAAAAVPGGHMAPAGDAWEVALGRAPDPTLYASDGSHPTARGTYLAACAILGTLERRSVVGADARPAEVTADDAAALQRIADEVVARAP